MFLQPKKKKFKKEHKKKVKTLAYKSNKITFGSIALQASSFGLISSKQLEAARQSINRKIKRKGKIWIRIFPDQPITRKPSEVRMGKGKGSVSFWATKVKAGTVLFEICGVPFKKAIVSLATGGAKLPVKTKIIKY